MAANWFFIAFAIFSISKANSAHSAGQDGKTEDGPSLISALVGFKPCLDENCESYGPSVLVPKDPALEASKEENPRAHCMLLKPSAVKYFYEIEKSYPGISSIKYRLLEELIEYMYSFTSLELDCQPAMQLLDLVILAGNSLKAQYMLQGGKECIYTRSTDETGKPVPSEKETEVPCKAGYVTESTICSDNTTKPKTETPVTEKPYVPSSTKQPTTQKPYVTSSTKLPSPNEPEEKPCTDAITEKPYPPSIGTVAEEPSDTEESEIIAEDEESELEIPQVGSLKGVPGVDYPSYTNIPITSFTCADKKYIPGFYADLDTGCQVFHVCYEHRRESFLCPVGTIFNQPILACDYWYSSNCSLAPYYYDVNKVTELEEEKIDVEVEELLSAIAESEKAEQSIESSEGENALEKIAPFFPVKAVITDIKPKAKVSSVPIETNAEEIASEIVDKMATTATKIISSTREVVKSTPEPEELKPALKPIKLPVFKPMKMEDLLKEAVVPLAKAKLAAIPVSKVTALKTAVPVAGLAAKTKIVMPIAVTKAKLATKVAAIPAMKVAAVAPVLVKGKMAAAIPATKVAVAAPVIAKAKTAATKVAVAAPVIAKGKIAVPTIKVATAKVAAKSSIPVLKAKMVASAVPLAKTKIVPLMKAKVIKGAGTPFVKAKMLSLPLAKSKLAGPLPLAKVKLAKAAAISPLTKKALALGYMKLLKAKKIALMG